MEIAKTDGDVQERFKKVDVSAPLVVATRQSTVITDPRVTPSRSSQGTTSTKGTQVLGVRQRFKLVNKFVKE